MDHDRRCLRLCAGVLVSAILFRLAAVGAFRPVGVWLRQPATASFLLYLETGRVVRACPEPTAPPSAPTEAPEPPTEPPTAPEPAALTFSEEEAEDLPIYYRCSYRPPISQLLTQPLDWKLGENGPKVLIVHTHTCESYTPEEPGAYESSGNYRTLDRDYSVVRIGALVAQRLEEAGIGVIHDREYHDYPSYNQAYPNTAASTARLLQEYPTLELVIDLHRDAADTPAGQLVTACSIEGQTAAQLMMVVGTGECGLELPQWQENLSAALKLQALLERENPGICRRLILTDQRYNQHLGKNALLIEVGAAGNTLHEAELAAQQLAEALIALADGSG